jgi:hypothetical protein
MASAWHRKDYEGLNRGAVALGAAALIFAFWLSFGFSVYLFGLQITGWVWALIGAFLGTVAAYRGKLKLESRKMPIQRQPAPSPRPEPELSLPKKQTMDQAASEKLSRVAQAASLSPTSPSVSTRGESPRHPGHENFSGLSGEQLKAAWQKGITLAALSLAQQDSANESKQDRSQEPSPLLREQLAFDKSGKAIIKPDELLPIIAKYTNVARPPLAISKEEVFRRTEHGDGGRFAMDSLVRTLSVRPETS